MPDLTDTLTARELLPLQIPRDFVILKEDSTIVDKREPFRFHERDGQVDTSIFSRGYLSKNGPVMWGKFIWSPIITQQNYHQLRTAKDNDNTVLICTAAGASLDVMQLLLAKFLFWAGKKLARIFGKFGFAKSEATIKDKSALSPFLQKLSANKYLGVGILALNVLYRLFKLSFYLPEAACAGFAYGRKIKNEEKQALEYMAPLFEKNTNSGPMRK